MPTIEQIRAARALIGWSQGDLAQYADLSQTGIARIENGTNNPSSTTLEKITSAFDVADIEFIGNSGVKKRTNEIRVLRGKQGFISFMDDVYETSKVQGGEICVFNVNEKNWIKWMGEEKYNAHSDRMKLLENLVNMKIIIKEGDQFFIASKFAEYRWFPENIFNPQSFYAYGDKLAFIKFSENDVLIQILNELEFSQGFRTLFNIAWNHSAIITKKKTNRWLINET